MTDGIVIQARSGSSRMPAKILLPFDGGQTILDIILEKIKRYNPGLPVIVATTTNPADDRIADMAARHNVECFRGSEPDVLSRFTGAADRFGLDRVIRVCSDNPFMQTDTFSDLIAAADSNPDADYVAFAFPDGRPTIKSHLGLYAELATADALRRAHAMAAEPDGQEHAAMPEAERKMCREHVTIGLYTHPADFSLAFLPLPEKLQERTDLRLTLDTPSDFKLLQELYRRLETETDGSLDALLEMVDANPQYGKIMKQNIAQNEK